MPCGTASTRCAVRAAALLALLSLARPAAAGPPAPAVGARSQPDLAGRSLRYAFHLHGGLALHHFLYQWARAEGGRLPGDRFPLPEMPERGELEALPEDDREALLEAVQHVEVFERAIQTSLAAAFEAAGVPEPRDLWHVMIFYLAGETVRRVLAADGQPGYEPHAERSGLYDRLPGWRGHARALERHWQPFLDGRTDRAAALAALAESYRSTADAR